MRALGLKELPLLAKYINLRRLIVGSTVLALGLAPLYVLALRTNHDRSVLPAALLDTPPVRGRTLDVGLSEGARAPDFEVSRPDGSRLRLSELRGRPVLINFWATWCGSCLSEMPEIKALQAERGEAAFTVLAVNTGETREKAVVFIDFLDAPFLYGLDPDMRVADAYGVYGLPLSVFVDSAGVIQAVYRGHANRELLEKFVDAAVKAEPAGPIPPVLRIISTIPRERVLTVTAGNDSLTMRSRSLRCDAGYCAESSIEPLRGMPGVTSMVLGSEDGDGVLTVRFRQGMVPAEAIVQAAVAALEATQDPVYQGPLHVRYVAD